MTEPTQIGTFEKDFLQRIKDIERRANEVGASMEAVCGAAGASSYTPRRWKKKPPYTIGLVDRLERVLSQMEQEKQHDIHPA